MQRVVSFGLLTFGAVMLWSVGAHARQPMSTPEIMAEKMDQMQQLVAAVVLEDYEQIANNGRELDRLAEFQSWFVLPTPEYAQYSEEFRAAAQEIAAAGENENTQAASSGYAALVEKCQQCHQYMKRVRRSEERR